MTSTRHIQVDRVGQAIKLSGVISETTDFSALLHEIEGGEVLDFSGIEGSSWIGLVRLDEVLVELNKHFIFCNVPWPIYNFIRLMPGIQFRFEIRSVELELYYMDTLETCASYLPATIDEIRLLGNSEARNQIILDETIAIEGLRPALLPDDFMKEKVDHFQSPWFVAHKEEMTFWLRLLNFWVVTHSISLDMIASRVADLDFLLTQMEALLRPISSVLDGYRPHDMTVADNLKVMREWIDEEGERIKVKMDRILLECKKENRRVTQFGDDPEFNDGHKVHETLFALTEVIKSSGEFLCDIESIGHQASEMLIELDIGGNLRTCMSAVKQSSQRPALRSQLKNYFSMVVREEESSSVETLPEIYLEKVLAEINEEVSECVVLFQGFDLLRQVVEHRIAEANVVEAKIGILLDEEKSEWPCMELEVSTRIRKTLVTDQEKYAFQFFFPHMELDADADSQAPGEVLLF